MHIRLFLLAFVFSATATCGFAGAWGHNSFENDDALDWVANVLKSSGQSSVEKAIQAVAETSGYLEAPDCCSAIAACEVLAAAQGRASSDLPKEVAALARKLSSTQSEALRKFARLALEKILAKSELRSLWEESKSFETWKKAVEELKSRL